MKHTLSNKTSFLLYEGTHSDKSIMVGLATILLLYMSFAIVM